MVESYRFTALLDGIYFWTVEKNKFFHLFQKRSMSSNSVTAWSSQERVSLMASKSASECSVDWTWRGNCPAQGKEQWLVITRPKRMKCRIKSHSRRVRSENKVDQRRRSCRIASRLWNNLMKINWSVMAESSWWRGVLVEFGRKLILKSPSKMNDLNFCMDLLSKTEFKSPKEEEDEGGQ